MLSAWQRICLLMKDKFVKYLPRVLKGIFEMAALNPKMGVSGSDTVAALTDVLNEINEGANAGEAKAAQNIVTDEIEEKEVGIQMLSVFIDELGVGFYDYIQPASEIMLSLTDYDSNDSIRQTAVSSLPDLIRVYKQRQGLCADLVTLARHFQANIDKAMKKETETEVLISQVVAMKDIILELQHPYLSGEEVGVMGEQCLTIIEKSLKRIDEIEECKREAPEDEDSALDEEDLNMLKEEGKDEYDLQIATAELIGALFKTHKQFVQVLVGKLQQDTLRAAFESGVQKRLKLGLFILDDMIEHLGPTYFSQQDFMVIV